MVTRLYALAGGVMIASGLHALSQKEMSALSHELAQVQTAVDRLAVYPESDKHIAYSWHELLKDFYELDHKLTVCSAPCKRRGRVVKCVVNPLRYQMQECMHKGPWMLGSQVVQRLVRLSPQELKAEIEACKRRTLADLLPEVYAVIWYLYALAVKKGRSFHEGSFIIIGKGSHALFRYLITVSHMIGGEQRRVSTHLNDIAGEHHAIDVPAGFRGAPGWVLPNNAYTILFRNLDHGRLFIKPEPSGTYTRADRMHHSFGLLKSIWYGSVGAFDRHGFAKERVPSVVKKALKNFLIAALRDDCHTGLFGGWIETCYNCLIGNTKAARIKNFLKELDRKGIKHISHIIERVTEQYMADNNCLALKGAAYDALKELEACLSWYDHCEYREGNEVILAHEEIMAGL